MGYKVHTVDGKAGEVDLTHLRTRSHTAVFPSPANGNHVVWRAPVACHVTAVRGLCTGGTSIAINAATSGGDVLASPLTVAAGSAYVSANAAQNQAIAAGTTLTFKLSSASGSPTELAMQVDYTVDIPA